MIQRFFPLFTAFAIAAVLWVVPSIVSQGMVTVGERFGHADQELVETGRTTDQVRLALLGADARVETAIASTVQPESPADVRGTRIAAAPRVD